MRARIAPALLLAGCLAACGEAAPLTEVPEADAGSPIDAAPAMDAEPEADAGSVAPDAEPAGDAGPDAGAPEADAGHVDRDAAAPDAEPQPRTPPAPRPYSEGTCPTLTGGATANTSVITGFTTGGNARDLRLLVPTSYDGTQPFPLLFAWHWLNASAGSFIRDGQLESAAEELGMIVVLPEKKRRPNGDKAYVFDWPFAETWGAEEELVFFDDLLTCIDQQYQIDRERVYAVGVSAGALWATYVSTSDRANYLAAVETLSGGLGEVLGTWRMEYTSQPNKFPALVLWGGSRDWLGLSFNEASIRYRDALLADGHFVIECIHDAGHAMPPVEAAPGASRFNALWRFLLDHRYGLDPGDSPYRTSGLPADFPKWCRMLP